MKKNQGHPPIFSVASYKDAKQREEGGREGGTIRNSFATTQQYRIKCSTDFFPFRFNSEFKENSLPVICLN